MVVFLHAGWLHTRQAKTEHEVRLEKYNDSSKSKHQVRLGNDRETHDDGRAARPRMPPPSTPCPTCGKLFFAHSLSMHTEQCATKMGRQLEMCPACGISVPRSEMNSHLNSCKSARDDGRSNNTQPFATEGAKKRAATTRASPSRTSSPRGARTPTTDQKPNQSKWTLRRRKCCKSSKRLFQMGACRARDAAARLLPIAS